MNRMSYKRPGTNPLLQEEVTIVDKFVGDSSLNTILDDLCMHRTTKRLILRGNFITSLGASKIAEFLMKDDVLQFLSLEWNELRSEVKY